MSGGNKRKLNFAISLLDYPEVIFLDETTTGKWWKCLDMALGMSYNSYKSVFVFYEVTIPRNGPPRTTQCMDGSAEGVRHGFFVCDHVAFDGGMRGAL